MASIAVDDHAYRSSEDEDYVPEDEEKEEKDIDSGNEKELNEDVEASIKQDIKKRKVDDIWESLNAENTVSLKSRNKSSKVLNSLLGKQSKGTTKSKKKKFIEFTMPSFGITKKSRRNLNPQNVTVAKEVTFAGQKYTVSKEVVLNHPNKTSSEKTSALDQMLQATQNPKKINSVEKSSYDWDKFKKSEGIEDELNQYTKDGYLEKQEFLQRVDLRQFEKEKKERESKRQLSK